jgi:pre-rRNA-processing protein TSR2
MFVALFYSILEGKNVEPEDLEDILLEVMSREFHICLEDGSEREIAKMLFDLYRECIRGERSMLEILRKKAQIRASKCDSIAQCQASEFVVPVSDGEAEFEDGEDCEDEDESMEM